MMDVDDEEEEFETDWEAQKSQWLTRLQDDGQTSSAPATEADLARSEKQKQLVRQLKGENAELRRQLDEKTEADKLLDTDEVIGQERQRLIELQQVQADVVGRRSSFGVVIAHTSYLRNANGRKPRCSIGEQESAIALKLSDA